MTTSSVTLERMRDQIQSCEKLSGKLQEVIGKIQKVGIRTGLLAEAPAKRREVPLAGEALGDLKGEATQLSLETDNLVNETRDMLKVAAKRYTGKESKQLVSDLKNRLFVLEEHKRLLQGSLRKEPTQKRRLKKERVILPRKRQEEASKETSLEQKRTHDEVEGPEEEIIPAKKVQEEKPAQKILTELNDFVRRHVALAENFDSTEGRALFRDMMKYDFFALAGGSYFSEPTFSDEEKGSVSSALQEIDRWKGSFLQKYASEQKVQEVKEFLERVKETDSLKLLEDLLGKLKSVSVCFWEKEDRELREKMKAAIPRMEKWVETATQDSEFEQRIQQLPVYEQKGEKPQTFQEIVESKEPLFPSVPTNKPSENTEYNRIVEKLTKLGMPHAQAVDIAPQAMLQATAIREQKQAMEEVSQKQTAAIKEASSEQQKERSDYGKPVLQKLRFIGRLGAGGTIAFAGIKGLVENASLWDAAFTVAGASFESLILFTGPELACKAYAEWDWMQICAATVLGVGTVIIFGGMSTPVLGAAAGVALVAGEMSKNPTFRETVDQIVKKTWEGMKKITQNIFIGKVVEKS